MYATATTTTNSGLTMPIMSVMAVLIATAWMVLH
jgi:hypothetical protein